jgi:Peptidase family M23
MTRIALALLLVLAAAPAAHADGWLRPVTGPVLRPFTVGPDPYERGQHRGVDLAAARGSPVRSTCAGRVSFAGRVPRGGPTVSVRCGALVATYQQLGSIAVRAGEPVRAGALLGSTGRSSDPRERRAHVHVGARVAATGRYLDPLTLFGAPPPGVPLLPPATGRVPRPAPLGPAPARPAPVSPREAPVPRAAPARPLPAAPRVGPARPLPVAPRIAPRAPEPRLPWSVWAGLACVGIGLPVGGFVRLRQRRRATRRVAQTA